MSEVKELLKSALDSYLADGRFYEAGCKRKISEAIAVLEDERKPEPAGELVTELRRIVAKRSCNKVDRRELHDNMISQAADRIAQLEAFALKLVGGDRGELKELDYWAEEYLHAYNSLCDMERIQAKVAQLEGENKLKAEMIGKMHRDIRKQNNIVAEQAEEIKVYRRALEGALRISDLWTLKEVETQFEDEAKALETMRISFEQALKGT